jgi:hypothetical protein
MLNKQNKVLFAKHVKCKKVTQNMVWHKTMQDTKENKFQMMKPCQASSRDIR